MPGGPPARILEIWGAPPRALGASRRQVLASVLVEALAVGVIAALLGLAASPRRWPSG